MPYVRVDVHGARVTGARVTLANLYLACPDTPYAAYLYSRARAGDTAARDALVRYARASARR